LKERADYRFFVAIGRQGFEAKTYRWGGPSRPEHWELFNDYAGFWGIEDSKADGWVYRQEATAKGGSESSLQFGSMGK